MDEFIMLLLVSAGSGALWSMIQFGYKYLDPTNTDVTKLADFHWGKFAVTVLLNTIGGAAGLVALQYLFNIQVDFGYAIACGLYGEKGLQLLQVAVGKLTSVMPGAKGGVEPPAAPLVETQPAA